MAEVEGKRVHLYSRSGFPYEKKFPKICENLAKWNVQAVLDGEIVNGEDAIPRYYVFDILYHDGQDLRKRPLKHRKQILEQLLKKKKGKDRENDVLPAETVGPKAKGKLPQLVAKNLESQYRSGTTSDWLILKNPSPSNPSSSIDKTTPSPLQLTNLDKFYWPVEGITKGDLLDYYRKIAPYILPYLKDRPESLNRMPNGITAPGFYQKDMIGHLPKWLKTHRVYSESADKTITYALCQDLPSLLYIVNLGCIEINPWFSRIKKPDHPDFMVIDLDPDGNNFDHVIEIALRFHEILEEVGAKNFCKTSGATGLHIGVPMGARYEFDKVRAFAEALCRIVAREYPATTSIDRNPQKRRGKIYLDYMQNRRGQTLAAPFCVRPMPGAPISMPLPWKELRRGLRPGKFNIHNALTMIKKWGDSWKEVLEKPVNLKACLKSIKKIDPFKE